MVSQFERDICTRIRPNNKGWQNGIGAGAIGCATPGWAFATSTGDFSVLDAPFAGSTAGESAGSYGGVNRRENLAFNSTDAVDAGGPDYTYLPTEIPGVALVVG